MTKNTKPHKITTKPLMTETTLKNEINNNKTNDRNNTNNKQTIKLMIENTKPHKINNNKKH